MDKRIKVGLILQYKNIINMTEGKLRILKQIEGIEKAVKEAVKSKRILIGNVKDNLSDKLDKVSDQIDNLKDDEKINAAEEKELKRAVRGVKSQLDVDLND